MVHPDYGWCDLDAERILVYPAVYLLAEKAEGRSAGMMQQPNKLIRG